MREQVLGTDEGFHYVLTSDMLLLIWSLRIKDMRPIFLAFKNFMTSLASSWVSTITKSSWGVIAPMIEASSGGSRICYRKVDMFLPGKRILTRLAVLISLIIFCWLDSWLLTDSLSFILRLISYKLEIRTPSYLSFSFSA